MAGLYAQWVQKANENPDCGNKTFNRGFSDKGFKRNCKSKENNVKKDY